MPRPPSAHMTDMIVALRSAPPMDPPSSDLRIMAGLRLDPSLAASRLGDFGAGSTGVRATSGAGVGLLASFTLASGCFGAAVFRVSGFSSKAPSCRASSNAWKAVSSTESLILLFAMRLRLVTHTPGFMPLDRLPMQADCRHHASGTYPSKREQSRHLPNPECW